MGDFASMRRRNREDYLTFAGQADSTQNKEFNDRVKSTGKGRIAIVLLAFTFLFSVITARLVQYGLNDPFVVSSINRSDKLLASRPDLVDRNGLILATDISTNSLYAEPRRIVDVDEALEKLVSVLPDLDMKKTYRKLNSKSAFQWLRRQLTPSQKREILGLGIPGIGFRPEKRRFYPSAATSVHLTGIVDIDNRGTAGMEKFVDDEGLSALYEAGMTIDEDLKAVRLSMDLRVQHILRDELSAAMRRYKAVGVGAVVLNANTGEVVAMTSLPDYNPNDTNRDVKLNLMSAGTFEMGSTFKAFTTAMALDSGLVSINDRFDARKPIKVAGHKISDFHGKHRVLDVSEIFIYSSNIGTVKMADIVGPVAHKKFLQKLGLLNRMKTELPEVARPYSPKKWKKINSVTISFGHGMSTTPLQTAVAAAAMVNGGKLIPPTFVPRTQKAADEIGVRVIKKKTSDHMRYLMALNVEKGSGRRAAVHGYRVGGKTGTAEKVVNGRYSSKVRFNAFLSTFPVDDPKYVVLVVIDEPKPENGEKYATAGMNAAPTVRAIIRRSASILGVKPKFYKNVAAMLEP